MAKKPTNERPILFSGDMVRAILEGRKRQTRRVAKVHDAHIPGMISPDGSNCARSPEEHISYCPYGQPGDCLWVREAWTSGYQDGAWGTIFQADGSFLQGKRQHDKGPHFHAKELGAHLFWRPSIHMPRWASRITLEITKVRVERVQEISKADCIAEGMTGLQDVHAGWHQSYAQLWDSINAKRGFGWDVNPWCWCIEFRGVAKKEALR